MPQETPRDGHNARPRVTIGIPVYNAQRFLRGALDSVLDQTFPDFEVVISDNASTDETESICREYAASEPRIRYIRQPENRGAAFNFNAVMEQATGEFFMWAAADDKRDRDFLRLAVMVFDADPKCGLVFSDYVVKNLRTGESTTENVAMYNSAKPWRRYFVRLLAPCPSLIYGLHRLSELRKIPARDYDFFDVHLTHWYAINSSVKVIPLPLYVAGVKDEFLPDGRRVHIPGTAQRPKADSAVPDDAARGSTGVHSPMASRRPRFDPTRFFADERHMLFTQCPPLPALGLYCLLQYFYFRNVRRLNAIIDQAQNVK